MAKYPYIRVAIVFDDENQRDKKLAKALDAELILAGALVLAVPSDASERMRKFIVKPMANGAPMFRLTAPSRRIGRPPGAQNKLPPGPRLTLFHWLRVAVCGGNHQERGSVGAGGAVTFTYGVPKFGSGIVVKHPHKLAFGGEVG